MPLDISVIHKMKVLTLLLLLIPTVLSIDCCFELSIDYVGNDLTEWVTTPNSQACQASCQTVDGCEFWSWNPASNSNACWRKFSKAGARYRGEYISGPKYCPDSIPDPRQLRVMSYNMWGDQALNDSYRQGNICTIIRTWLPDLLGGQESRENLSIGEGYASTGGAGGHNIIYRTSSMDLNGYGYVDLTPNDKWGIRSVEWAQFTHRATGTLVDHFNTHFCVCADDGRCCGQEAQYQSAKEVEQVIVEHRRVGSLIVLTGDLNVQDGYEYSKAVRYLKGEIDSPPVPLQDTFRANGNNADGTTYPGEGKIDYIFASPEYSVDGAYIDREDYGAASDHWPIVANIVL